MRRSCMFAALALLSATTIFATPDPRPGWFLCDAVDAPVAALVDSPGGSGRIRVMLVSRGTGLTSSAIYRIGRAEAGMSQLHYTLSRNSRPVGDLHAVQPDVLSDPASAWTPTFSSVTIDKQTLGCRWVANTLFLGLDARRSIQITQENGALVYRSFDAARRGVVVTPPGYGRTNAATLTITGGVRQRVGPVTRFRFVNAGYLYQISAPDRGEAQVIVRKAGRIVQTERLLGFMRHDP